MSKERKSRIERAKEYVLAHPDESKAEQAAAIHVSSSTIAVARAQLISEGLLMPSRKAPPTSFMPALDESLTDPIAPVAQTKAKTNAMLDHDAMIALAKMVDEIEGLSDEEVFKRIQRQCLLFTFDTRLHADTRMSASAMWTKLKEKAKEKDLGPGAPLTFEDGVARLAELHVACGPEMVLAAVNVAFTVQEKPNEGEIPADTSEAPRGPSGTPETPASLPDLRPDDSATGPQPLG